MSLFLCMVLESVLVSFFYKWLTSFPSPTCWRDCLFHHCLFLRRLYLTASSYILEVRLSLYLESCSDLLDWSSFPIVLFPPNTVFTWSQVFEVKFEFGLMGLGVDAWWWHTQLFITNSSVPVYYSQVPVLNLVFFHNSGLLIPFISLTLCPLHNSRKSSQTI